MELLKNGLKYRFIGFLLVAAIYVVFLFYEKHLKKEEDSINLNSMSMFYTNNILFVCDDYLKVFNISTKTTHSFAKGVKYFLDNNEVEIFFDTVSNKIMIDNYDPKKYLIKLAPKSNSYIDTISNGIFLKCIDSCNFVLLSKDYELKMSTLYELESCKYYGYFKVYEDRID